MNVIITLPSLYLGFNSCMVGSVPNVFLDILSLSCSAESIFDFYDLFFLLNLLIFTAYCVTVQNLPRSAIVAQV